MPADVGGVRRRPGGRLRHDQRQDPAGDPGRRPRALGPYYLWRLLIDERAQRQGYGTACLDAVVAYLRTRPGAETLWTSCGQGPGTPQPFYERYGFVATDRFIEGERVMRLDLRPEPA